MPKARVNAQIDTPTVDVLVDMGHPLLNRIVDGFVKVGGVSFLCIELQQGAQVYE